MNWKLFDAIALAGLAILSLLIAFTLLGKVTHWLGGLL